MKKEQLRLTDKSAIYCRVSTDKQTTENQNFRLLQYAENHNLDFDLYDEVESTRKTRPLKQELLQKIRNGEYKEVIVYKLDRWARSSRELILEIQELTDKGVRFVSLSDNLDFSTSTGRLHFHILAAFAEFERSLISERTKEALARLKKQDIKLGRPTGSKDSKPRSVSGYYLREAQKKKSVDEVKGHYKSVQTYISKYPPPNNSGVIN
jgi:putative DNA-invertase from lambdoid prophage Rac